jgi:demethylmenaquinone methyltransferase/2-methoxy-6-polyprenyl-1,4-benzoquinol methylase
MEPTVTKKPLHQWSDTERIVAVKQIFNTITPHYDLLNRIMSGRRDVAWRRFAVTRVPADAERVIDVATGTGDLAMDIAGQRDKAQVFGVDFVEKMMRQAQTKTSSANLSHRITYVAGDAMSLPFDDNEFDAATVAFGIRNMPDRLGALKEMVRVVKPGGKIICLEMTFPRNLGLRRFFTWYLNNVIPFLGGLISRNPRAYTYLPDSIQDFLHPEDLSDLFQKAHLKSVSAFPLTLGLTYLHEGFVS